MKCFIVRSFVYISCLIVVSATIDVIDMTPLVIKEFTKDTVSGKPAIRFKDDGTLKIVNFSDL